MKKIKKTIVTLICLLSLCIGLVFVTGMSNDAYTIFSESDLNKGYEFSHWSDGVKTAIRTDTNIISYVNVKAIFVKVDD